MPLMRSRKAQLGVATVAALTLSGCGQLPWQPAESGAAGATSVVVRITSDSASPTSIRVQLDARENPQLVESDKTTLPYEQSFEVANNVPLPLNGTRVEAKKPSKATFVACEILYNGKTVSQQRSDTGSTVVCEKKIRLGPQ